MPTEQFVLTDCPAAEYLPVGHSKHKLKLVLPLMVEYVPTGQLVHADADLTAEYVPAVQVLHTDKPVVPP